MSNVILLPFGREVQVTPVNPLDVAQTNMKLAARRLSAMIDALDVLLGTFEGDINSVGPVEVRLELERQQEIIVRQIAEARLMLMPLTRETGN